MALTQGHQPRRRFGQNFLVDAHYVQRIVAAIDPKPGERVVEVGPGLAALTDELVARAGHITAIEIDRDLAARLRERYPPERLTLVEGDALDFEFSALGTDLRIVGNLPYNISSPMLFHLAASDAHLRDVHVMLQKEVVDRMSAQPGTPAYGRLTVMLQARFAVQRLFIVPPGAFRPPPKVDSAVARLAPLRDKAPAIDDFAVFARLVAAAFSQRRKTLRNALGGMCDSSGMIGSGVDPAARGETLAVADFVRLANAIAHGTSQATRG